MCKVLAGQTHVDRDVAGHGKRSSRGAKCKLTRW
jgi:hypothetical protein